MDEPLSFGKLDPLVDLMQQIINGVAIEAEAVLSDGDWVLLGETELMYAASDDPSLTNAVHQRRLADRDMREKNTPMWSRGLALPPLIRSSFGANARPVAVIASA